MNLCSCWKEYIKYVIKEKLQYVSSKKRKEKKIMNTAEMWLQAQKDGLCYKMIISENNGEELFYQKNVGLFDGDGYVVEFNNFGEFDDFMLNRWEARIMTRAEAEAKFYIKIVD